MQELTAYFSPSRGWDSIVVSLVYLLKEKVFVFFVVVACIC